MTGFEGFPEQALDFYEGLEADNSKAYWTDHRAVYEESVRTPVQALLDVLAPEFGVASLFRPYRDVRFSRDKTPYKTAAAAAVGDDVQGGLYVQLSAAGLKVAGGAHGLATDQARRLRAAVADDRTGPGLVALLARLRGAGFAVEGERLVRVPPELRDVVPEDPERAGLLTLKTLYAVRDHPPASWLHTAEAAEVVARNWRLLAPLNDWLRDHVGPTRTPRLGRP